MTAEARDDDHRFSGVILARDADGFVARFDALDCEPWHSPDSALVDGESAVSDAQCGLAARPEPDGETDQQSPGGQDVRRDLQRVRAAVAQERTELPPCPRPHR